MNRELMEKIAANSDAEADALREIILSKPIGDDPDYPYGNKLGTKYVIKKGLKGALTGGGYGAALGGLFSAPAWLGNYPSLKTKDKLKYSGAFTSIGAGIGALTNGILSAREASGHRPMSYLPSKDQKNIRSNYIKADTAVAKAEKKYDDAMDVVERFWEDPNLDDNNRAYIKAYDKKYDTQERLHDAFSDRDKAENDYFDAYARGKALMLAEKKNRRLLKKASDYLDDAVMEKEARAKIEYVAMGKNSDGKDCVRTVRLTRAEAKKFMKNRKLPVGNLVINRRNKKVYLVDDNGKRTKRHIGVMTSEKMI